MSEIEEFGNSGSCGSAGWAIYEYDPTNGFSAIGTQCGGGHVAPHVVIPTEYQGLIDDLDQAQITIRFVACCSSASSGASVAARIDHFTGGDFGADDEGIVPLWVKDEIDILRWGVEALWSRTGEPPIRFIGKTVQFVSEGLCARMRKRIDHAEKLREIVERHCGANDDPNNP